MPRGDGCRRRKAQSTYIAPVAGHGAVRGAQVVCRLVTLRDCQPAEASAAFAKALSKGGFRAQYGWGSQMQPDHRCLLPHRAGW